MIPVIMVTHGSFAKAAKETTELIVGKMEDVWTFGIHEDTEIEKVEDEISEIVNSFDEKQEIIILCDILGGTPSNISLKLIDKYNNLIVYVGFNLPVLLELALNRNNPIEEVEQLIQKVSKESFVKLELKEFEDNNTDDLSL